MPTAAILGMIARESTPSTTPSVAGWGQVQQLNKEGEWFVSGDLLVGAYTSAPAFITLDHWTPTVGQNALKQLFAKPDVTGPTAPVAATATTPSVAGWGQIQQLNKEGEWFVSGDLLVGANFSAPALNYFAAWKQQEFLSTVSKAYSKPETVAPVRTLPTVYISSLETLIAATAVVNKFAKPDVVTPEKVFPTISISGWESLRIATAVLKTFAKPDIAAPDKALPPYQVTLAAWESLRIATAVLLRYATADVSQPVLTLPTVSLASWLQYLAQNSLPNIYSKVEALVAPAKTLPPAAITIDHWLQYLAQNNLNQPYLRGDLYTAPDKTLPTLTIESIDSWLQYLAANAVKLGYTAGDQYTAPSKVLPPAPITINHWLSTLGANAVPSKFNLAVNDERVSPFVSIYLSSWFLEVPSIAREIGYSSADSLAAPGLLPLPFVSLASWLQDTAQAAMSLKTQPGGFVAPEKTFLASVVLIQNLVGQNNLTQQYWQIETIPSSFLVLVAPVTIAHWLQMLPPIQKLDLKYLAGQMSMPDKVLPPAPVTLDHWLQYLGQNNLQQPYLPGDFYTAPTLVIPFVPSSFVLKLGTAVTYPALKPITTSSASLLNLLALITKK